MNSELKIKLEALRKDIFIARDNQDWLLIGFALNDLDTILYGTSQEYLKVHKIDSRVNPYISNEPKDGLQNY